jgi:AraC family transcriptional regulator of adaptative response / methylphosphotriester-DNA alkyltransferase methyltransferase
VRDVANSVGYRQPAQFAKTFRRHHGAPPSSFRGARSGASGSSMSLHSV